MTDSEHYFEESPSIGSEPRRITVDAGGLRFEMTTDRGVFGYGRLDRGTAILLDTVPAPPPSGVLVDLGCGAGAIAVSLAQRSPAATVWAVDVNRRALDLVGANAAALGLTNVVPLAPADVPPGVEVATIWSNPPIRIGKERLHQMLDEWLPRLTGEAWFVVQKHLGADSLQRWLRDAGWNCDRVVSRAGYRVLRVGHSDALRVDGDPQT